MTSQLLGWWPILWTARVVLLILLLGIGLSAFLYFARFCRPRHILVMLRADLPRLARSAAATGDDANARLRLQPGARSVKRSLKGSHARITQDGIETGEERIRFLERLRDKYYQIRGIISGDAS